MTIIFIFLEFSDRVLKKVFINFSGYKKVGKNKNISKLFEKLVFAIILQNILLD